MHDECRADRDDRNERWRRLENEALAGHDNLPPAFRDWFYAWAAEQCRDYCEVCDHQRRRVDLMEDSSCSTIRGPSRPVRGQRAPLRGVLRPLRLHRIG